MTLSAFKSLYAVAALVTAISMVVLSAPTHASKNTLFEDKSKRASATQVLPQWQRVLSNHMIERSTETSHQYNEWKKFINSIRHEPKLRQMKKVNMWFKKFSYKYDHLIYKEIDYWATPSEFLSKGGDCEDYAIIKYMTLKELGFNPNDMKIAMVYDVYSGTDHSFLVVHHDGAEFVLDNREKLVVSRYMKKRYRAHYAFNENHVWAYDKPLMARKMRSGTRDRVLPGNQ